jgi:16S rRNA G527 N7-methylase RsmG
MDLNDDLAKNQRFLREIEQAIRLSNNEVIHNRIPPITSERMLTFAVAVAKMRA